ncbi:MAG: phospholipid carrier-dependent glycosyltransferase [Dehalococcoidales bacterium]|jgi:dolichyl-phosphate-mannose--protein O-mannosyl transferase
MEIKSKIVRAWRWPYFWLSVIVITTLVLHFVMIPRVTDPILDEIHYIKDARNIITNHASERIEHPPLAKLLIVAGEYVFSGFRTPVQDTGVTLRQGITSTSGTVINVSNASVFKVGETIMIDKEYMKIQAVDLASSQLTVERGNMGAAAFHNVNQPINRWVENPWGWRVFPVLFSTATLILFFFLCRKLGMSLTASNVAVYLLAFENLTFMMGGLAMLDVYFLTFMMAAFVLYVYRRYISSGVAIGLGALAKLNGALAFPVIFVHWVFTREKRTRWFILTLIFSLLTFIEIMILCEFLIAHGMSAELNPFHRIKEMLQLSGSLTFANVDHPFKSYPWDWLIFYRPMPFWYMPHYTAAISFTIWALTMPTFGYLIYRAIKRDEAGLFALSWFFGTFLIWIPIILITDRVSYLYYFYPVVGAVCMGVAIGLDQLLDWWRHRLRGKLKWTALLIVIFVLALHMFSFLILSPLIKYDFLPWWDWIVKLFT